VAAGQRLTLDDLGFKRPGTGIAPFEYDRVIGRSLKDTSPAGTVITEEALV
jgi:sialic acid synthase SpsE